MTSSESSFTLDHDVSGKIAVIIFDVPGVRVNTLSTSVAGELCALLDELSSDHNITAVTLFSGKKDTFIAGADIKEFLELESEKAAVQLVEHAQVIMNSIANFPKPIVSLLQLSGCPMPQAPKFFGFLQLLNMFSTRKTLSLVR